MRSFRRVACMPLSADVAAVTAAPNAAIVTTTEYTTVLEGHTNEVTHTAFVPDGSLVTSCSDGNVRKFAPSEDGDGWELLKALEGEHNVVWCVDANSERIVLCDDEGCVIVCDSNPPHREGTR